MNMLIDTVAQAIWNEHAGAEGAGSWEAAEPALRERFLGYARVAVQAMSHPTPHMLSEGNRALQTWEHSEHYRSPVDGIWHAMIVAEVPDRERPRRVGFDEL
ncbi:hypothetical protein SCD90_14485 [Terrihabitans sp. PJ23]|uniref:Uncharacterized protein n=2 Tax=Terrihabitans rhizophilus TaxID=3092662 RepID=A0ABU4RR15_9HYPH|nr:hypothetical protein [Terrihabitans sp. PJ23]